ncbi:syntenin-2 isoform X9 [Physeter macrocephalus]|uniref:Syntenin-2 isoform X9 n=1 Tax=Physeter macrocephalus TaxID=9755 RepID=A0A9W2X5F5_PHYMC|nr:syntenin-2 isoform X9 [Physeter catodon]
MSVPPLSPQPSSPSVPCRVFQRAAMSTLYPSLEDLKVDQAMQAEARAYPGCPPCRGREQTPSLQPRSPAEPASDSRRCQCSGLGPLTGPGGGAGVREQLGRAAWGGQARCARDPPVQGRPRQDGAAAAGHRRSLSVHPQPRPRPSSPTLPARPFQQNVTMHKDSTGHVGFVIKKGKLISSVKGSSVARNGLLINHYVCEVNGQNVLGLKDKEVTEILATAGNVTNLTIIPTVIYEHMVRKLSPALLHHTVDHSIADI